MSIKVRPRLPNLPALFAGGLSGLDPETALTPHRQSYLVLDFPEPQTQRLPFTLYREGHDITPCYSPDLGVSHDVTLLPTGWWAIEPWQMKYTFERTEVQPGIIRQSGGSGSSVPNVGLFQTAPGWQEHPMWRTPTELTGLSFDPSAAATGDYFIVKGVTALGDWSSSMPYGPGADTPPPLGGTMIQMHRAAIGDTTHEENTGYAVRFDVPQHLASSPDVVAQVTFGGPTPTWDRKGNPLAHDFQAGTHAMVYRGNGGLGLFEYGGPQANWRQIWDGAVKGIGAFGRTLFHMVVPQGKGHFSMVAAGQKAVHSANPVAAATPHPRAIPIQQVAIHPDPIANGYSRKNYTTGPGMVKFDHRADIRMYFQVSRLIYPQGLLVDEPFFCSFELKTSATPDYNDDIVVTVVKDEPPGTSITVQVCDPGFLPGAPGNLLAPDTSYPGLAANQTAWIPRKGQQAYYVVFTFNPSSDGLRTPFLKGYHVLANGIRVDFPPDTSWNAAARSYSITSADLDPTHESCQMEFGDLNNDMEALRIRARIPIQVRTRYDPADATKFSVLFQGETALVHATKRGRLRKAGMDQNPSKPDTAYPSKDWRNLEVSGVGMASRVADQLAMASFPFAAFDRDNPSVSAPSKVTSAIDTMIDVLGYPNDMRDVPDMPVRCFSTENDNSEFILQPTANVIEFIIHMARKYLGAYIVYDANAGGAGMTATTARGMWRLRLPPVAPYTPLWTFTTAPPPRAGPQLAYKLPPPGGHSAYSAAYGDQATFIRRLKTWVQPPEGNYLIVTSTGVLKAEHRGKNVGTVVLWNPNSFNMPGLTTADPNGPDYLGRLVPLIYYEPNLVNLPAAAGVGDNEGLMTVAKRIYQQACVSQKWIEFDAPLVLVTDPSDPLQRRPRPLRLYDPIKVEDVNQGVMLSCVVRSVTLNWKNDRAQMMTVQALAPADANSGIVRSL